MSVRTSGAMVVSMRPAWEYGCTAERDEQPRHRRLLGSCYVFIFLSELQFLYFIQKEKSLNIRFLQFIEFCQ